MTCKRVIALYAVFVLLACAMLLRLALLASDPQYRAASADQSTAELTAVVKRPHFYDRGGQPITGTASGCLAVAVPGNPASYNILRALGEEQAEAFRERMQQGTPFLVPLDEQLPAHSLVTCLPSGGRTVPPLYSHLIGYLAWDGTGAAGLESAFEGMLAASSRRVRLRYPVDAMGSLLPDTLVSVVDEGAVSAGVLLTVDTRVQQAADDAAAHMRKGAVVVLDCRSGEILAMVSRPAYSADRVAEYLSDPDGALVNRALAQYSIGSVFKLVVQAAALEAGISADWAYTCTGSIAVGDTVFSCAGGGVHGELTMSGALAQSCNCYHIALAQLLGGSLHVTGAYPAWEYRRESPLRDKLAAVYTQQTGKEPKIEAIHAGLECGLFAGQLPGLDCVSFGPDLVDIHTTREKMSISSVQRTWQFLLGALAALKD